MNLHWHFMPVTSAFGVWLVWAFGGLRAEGVLHVDEDADHRNPGNHNAAENDRQVLLETLDRVIKVILGNERVADKFGIVLDKRLGLPIIKPGFVESLDRFQCVVGQCRHCWRSLQGGLSNIAPFAPYFQPVLQRSLPAALALLLALPAAGHSQTSRPIGSALDGPADLRASLGECRDDLLRDAWNDILPLEANAVEREVLALCTERAEAIARFLAAQERLDGALAERRATALNTEPGPDDARMERLRGEIESLRVRIVRLEGQPEGPETDAALADLRGDLAVAEAELARMEGGEETSSGTRDVPPPVAAVTDADEGEPSATEIVPPPTGDQAAESLPPPGTDPTGETPVPVAETAPDLPSEGPAEWRVVYAVRRDGGPWQVRLQADRMTPIPVPGATPEAPETFIFRPVSDPPVTLAVGEVLPGGMALLAVTPEGVEIGDPDDPDSEPVLVRFATAGDSDPGALEWEVQVLEGADQ